MKIPPRCSAISFVCAILLSACGGDSADTTPRTDREEVQFVIDYMKASYLWADMLPAEISADDYQTGQQALDALRFEKDRFSGISPAQEYNDFFAGKTVAFGFNFRRDDPGIRLFGILPNSPASTAGLMRGDLITAIDDKAVSAYYAENNDTLGPDAFGPGQVGVTRKFNISRGSDNLTFTVTKGAFNLSYVPASGVLDSNGRKVGYLNFYSFADSGVQPWFSTLDSFRLQGVQDLIVDLRFNGGGLLKTAAQIGSALGTESLRDRLMATLQFNSMQSGNNRSFSFNDDPRAGSFQNLIWLTSENTCSASESLILGVKAWRGATRIGEKTCGKPVGFTPPTFSNKVYSIVSFKLVNPQGETDYFEGLLPDCPVVDPGTGQLGQPDDPLTAAALQFLATGSCPPVATSDQQLKRAARPAPRGIDLLINLR